jgi:hypothetical protein
VGVFVRRVHGAQDAAAFGFAGTLEHVLFVESSELPPRLRTDLAAWYRRLNQTALAGMRKPG